MRDFQDYGGDEGGANIGIEENLTRLNVWIISEEEMGIMLQEVLEP